MSFYRYLLAGIAAFALTSPLFAEDASAPATTEQTAKTEQATESKSEATIAKVNINKAAAKDLMKVKGLNASKSRSIVAYRKKHGDFKSLDDLAKVKGFTKMKADALKAIEDQLTIE